MKAEFCVFVSNRGVAQDHPRNTLSAAFCAVARRIAETLHKIKRLLAYLEGSLRVGEA
ncbi:MAG: hypothetical protein WC966_09410 [Bradymonadales bacterium]